MDRNINYLKFITKIYSQEKSESNHLALMEMFRIFDISEKFGFVTDFSYDTMTALTGFYPEVMDQLAKYNKSKREKMFESVDCLNRLGARMFDVLGLYGKKAGNHAKLPNSRGDFEMINDWVWTDEYVVVGNTVLYMELKENDGIARVPSYVAGRYINRVGQGSLRTCNKQLKKVIIAPGIKDVAAQPEFVNASVLEYTDGVRKIEISENTLGTTKICFKPSKISPNMRRVFKENAEYKTTDDGYLLSGDYLKTTFCNKNHIFPQIEIYCKKSSPDEYDLNYKPFPGNEQDGAWKGSYTTLFNGNMSGTLSLYNLEKPCPAEDIDDIGQQVLENIYDKKRIFINNASLSNYYYIFYEHEDEPMFQIFIGRCLHYDVDVANICYKEKRYEVFRAYNAIASTDDIHALKVTDENGSIINDEDVIRYYKRRSKLVKMLSQKKG